MPYATRSRGTPRKTRSRRRRARPSATSWRLARRAGLALRDAGWAIRIVVGTVLLVAVWATVNGIVQVARKPTEALFPVSGSLAEVNAVKLQFARLAAFDRSDTTPSATIDERLSSDE